MSMRSAGVLLHVSSLPGEFGIGDLGPSARQWVDVLAAAGQTRWQILPLGPTDAGGGPYGSYSAFAGNPWLISPEDLFADGLLDQSELEAAKLPAGPVGFDRVGRNKGRLLDAAWEKFHGSNGKDFGQFCERQKHWLEDLALFVAVGARCKTLDWSSWDRPLAFRETGALEKARTDLAAAIDRGKFEQYLFDRQWRALRVYANERGVKIIGDVPIFVSGNSADVWVRPKEFLLDRHFRPKIVAGVPPDYFSADGQRWGNPMYDWPAMERDGFRWWIDRIRALTEQADIVRIDHFRGLAACWHIPAKSATARRGKWVKTPGAELLSAVAETLGDLPLIAEDLGLITPDVEALRDQFHLPGMRVTQFGFGSDPSDPFLPHNFVRNCVAYTGTHDNDTTAGWWKSLTPAERKRVRTYHREIDVDPVGTMIHAVYASVADTAIVPAQDVLSLGSRDRMNRPGEGSGNWRWRMEPDYHRSPRWKQLADWTAVYGRNGTTRSRQGK